MARCAGPSPSAGSASVVVTAWAGRIGKMVSASKMTSGPVLGSVPIPVNIWPKACPKIQ